MFAIQQSLFDILRFHLGLGFTPATRSETNPATPRLDVSDRHSRPHYRDFMKHPHLLNSDKKASVIILVNREKKVLLQLRDHRAPTAANKWSFFGGGVKPGENPFQCVLRECEQELGVTLSDPVLIIARCMDHPYFDEEYIYVEQVSDATIEGIRQREGADRGWFTFPQALQLDMVEDKKAILGAVFEYIHRVLE